MDALQVAALIAALIYALDKATDVVAKFYSGALSAPTRPICKECLACAVCGRKMTEDGTPEKPLKSVP